MGVQHDIAVDLRHAKVRHYDAAMDAALVQAMHAAELAMQTGSALATREVRRVRTALRDRGAQEQTQALTEHVRALTDVSR